MQNSYGMVKEEGAHSNRRSGVASKIIIPERWLRDNYYEEDILDLIMELRINNLHIGEHFVIV